MLRKLLKWSLRAMAGLAILFLVFVTWAWRPFASYHPLLVIRGRGSVEKKVALLTTYDRVMPYSVVPASSSPVRVPSEIRRLDLSYEWQGKIWSIQDYIRRERVAGLLVLSGGRKVFEQYEYGLTPETHYEIASATKSFTGTLIAMALQDGTIHSLDDRADLYAPQFRGSDYGATTIRHLLMMSSGINYFYNGPFYANWAAIYVRQLLIGQNPDDFNRAQTRNRPQGADFNYLALDTQVLGAVLRGAYHKPLTQIASEKIWQPLGMNRDAKWLQSEGKNGVTFAQAMLMPVLGDFALLGQLYVQNGVWRGKQLLPHDWTKQAGAPNARFQEPREDREGYGMQFWVPLDYDGEFYAAGLNGNYVWIDVKRGVAIAQFGASEDRGEVAHGERNAAFRAIAAKASGFAREEPVIRY